MDATEIMALIGSALVIATPLAHGLQRAADAFAEYALTTAGTDDDRTARKLQRWTLGLARALDFASSMLPVVRRGPGEGRQ